MRQMKLCGGLIVFHLPPKIPCALLLEIAPIASAASEVDRAKLLHHQLPPRTAPAQFAFPVRTANNLDLGIIFKSIFSVSHSWSHVKIYGSFFLLLNYFSIPQTKAIKATMTRCLHNLSIVHMVHVTSGTLTEDVSAASRPANAYNRRFQDAFGFPVMPRAIPPCVPAGAIGADERNVQVLVPQLCRAMINSPMPP